MSLLHPIPVPGGTVAAIPSKSHAHRLLIAAALSDAPVFLECPVSSRDIDATVSCLISMGAKIDLKENGFHVTPIHRNFGGETSDEYAIPLLHPGESGSTLRFLLPVLGALGLSAGLVLEGRLPERPLHPLDSEMERHGITFSGKGEPSLQISGKLTPGDYIIDGGVSSQYITGLLFALPLLPADSVLTVTGRLESRPYVDITLQALREFGIEIHEEKPDTDGVAVIFRIPGTQQYHGSSRSLRVEGDWSNTAFFLTAGALLANPVTVTGCRMDSPQGDRAIVNLLRQFGADIRIIPHFSPLSSEEKSSEEIYEKKEFPDERTDHGLCDISVSGGSLWGIDIDASQIPDLVPILAVAASCAEGTTVIRNIERLRIKESDRVATVCAMISGLGGQITEKKEGSSAFLEITGMPSLPGGTVSSYNDHRIAMAAAIASLRAEDSVTIQTPMAVAKSYPGFYTDLARILG